MDDSRRELEQESVEANAEAQGSSTQAEERREGPVLRRGRQVRSSTTDQRLLFVENSFLGTVEAYLIQPDHTLELVSTTTGLPRFDGHGMEGLVAL